jgi:PAS domain S-box-containing protein
MEPQNSSVPDVQLLSPALEACVIGVVITDARQEDYPVVYANPAFEQLSGYMASEIIGRNCRFLQGEDRDLDAQHAIRDALDQGQGVTTVLRNYHKDGAMFYNELTLSPIRDVAGTVTHYLGFQNDVTAREKALQREVQAREQLTATLSRVTDGFMSFDRDWNCTYVNEAAASFAGRQPEDFVGRNLLTSFPEFSGLAIGQAARQAEVTGNTQSAVSYMSPFERWVELTAYPGDDGMSLFTRDVTERQAVQEELRISEDRFAKVFLASPIAIFVTRQSDKHFVEVNDEFLRQSGYTREEIIGRSSQDLGFWADQADREVAWSMVDGHRPIHSQEVLFHSKTGDEMYGVLSIVPMEMAGEACVIGFVRDVTEERRARDHLQASEERFAKVFDASPVAIVVTQVSTGQCIDVNAEFLRRSGYVREEIVGRVLVHLDVWVNTQERDDFARTLQKDGKILNREVQFRMKSGAVSDSLVSVVPVTIGGEVCMVMLLRDITLEKQSKRVLAESEERHRQTSTRLQRTLDLSLDLINSIDAQGRFVTMSAACQQILGYAPEELIGRTYLDFVHPDDRAITAQEDDLITAGHATKSFQNRYLHKNGSVVWLEWAAVSLPDDPLMYCVARDITERRAAAEDQAFLAAIVQASHNSIIGLSLDGNIRSSNPAAQELYGYAADEVIGQPITFMVPDFDSEMLEFIRQGNRGQPFEGHRITKSGQNIQVMVTLSPILDAAGEVIGVSKISRDITFLKQAEQEVQALNEGLEQQLRHVTSLREIDQSIAASAVLGDTLGLILDNVMQQLGADAVMIQLVDQDSLTLKYAAARGFTTELRDFTSQPGEDLGGQVVLKRQPLIIPDLRVVDLSPTWRGMLDKERIMAYCAAPIIAKGKVLGVIEVLNRDPFKPSAAWLETFDVFNNQAAIAVDNNLLFSELERRNLELRLAYDETIEGWGKALDLRDKETEGHSRRVTEMTVALCQRFGLPPEQLVHVRRGALLHDIGKMGIPDAVLLKPGKLTDEEWVRMKRHPEFAVSLLSPIGYLRSALDIPQYHHEKWDGSGYPLGIKGAAIPMTARAFAVVDVYDALTSNRPYREAWTKERALEHIQNSAGTHFDPAVVQMFIRMLQSD